MRAPAGNTGNETIKTRLNRWADAESLSDPKKKPNDRHWYAYDVVFDG